MKFLKASKDFDFVLSLNYIYKIISGIKVLPTPVVGSVFVNSLKNICIDNETKDSILNMASGVSSVSLARRFVQNNEKIRKQSPT